VGWRKPSASASCHEHRRTLEQITLPSSRLDASLRGALATAIGADKVAQTAFERARTRAARAFTISSICARAASRPHRRRRLSKLARRRGACAAMASEHGVAIVPSAADQASSGGVTAARGSQRACVALDLTEMRKMIAETPCR